MIRDPYNTEACKAHVIQPVVLDIQKYIAVNGIGSGQVKPITEDLLGALTFTPGLAHIPSFGHPLCIDTVTPHWKPGDSNLRYIVDVRHFTRLNQNREVVIASSLDYLVATLRCRLQVAWANEYPVHMLNVGGYQVTVFTRWMTEVISNNLGLQPDVRMRATVIIAYYYLCLFQDTAADKFDERTLLNMASAVSRSCDVGADTVLTIIEPLPIMKGIRDFIAALKEHGHPIRFENFSLEVLISLVGGSWYGSNSKEIMGVALEHPPTFIALLYAALTDRGAKITRIGKVALLEDRSDAAKSFCMNVKGLLEIRQH
jgi:hypothetical protein